DPSWIDPLIPSGPTHFIVAWTAPYDSPAKSIHLQRFSIDGTLDPAWGPAGQVAAPSDSITGLTLIPDGQPGLHLLWYALGRPGGTPVLVAGSGPSGMTGPVELSGSSAYFRQPTYTTVSPPSPDHLGGLPLPYVVAGAASGGRLLFAYEDTQLWPIKR